MQKILYLATCLSKNLVSSNQSQNRSPRICVNMWTTETPRRLFSIFLVYVILKNEKPKNNVKGAMSTSPGLHSQGATLRLHTGSCVVCAIFFPERSKVPSELSFIQFVSRLPCAYYKLYMLGRPDRPDPSELIHEYSLHHSLGVFLTSFCSTASSTFTTRGDRSTSRTTPDDVANWFVQNSLCV